VRRGNGARRRQAIEKAFGQAIETMLQRGSSGHRLDFRPRHIGRMDCARWYQDRLGWGGLSLEIGLSLKIGVVRHPSWRPRAAGRHDDRLNGLALPAFRA
jgi:hypothetical protein